MSPPGVQDGPGRVLGSERGRQGMGGRGERARGLPAHPEGPRADPAVPETEGQVGQREVNRGSEWGPGLCLKPEPRFEPPRVIGDSPKMLAREIDAANAVLQDQ